MITLTNYANRKLEWFIAIYTVGFGAWLLFPANSMNVVTFGRPLSWLPEPYWGMLYFLIGVFHAVSLQVNGRAPWTPFARSLSLIANSQILLALAGGSALVYPWGTGVYTYAALALGACGPALFSATVDCGREISIWRKSRLKE